MGISYHKPQPYLKQSIGCLYGLLEAESVEFVAQEYLKAEEFI